MRTRKVAFLLSALVCLCACDSNSDPDFPEIDGAYDEFGVRMEVGGRTYSEGVSGVYLHRTMTLSPDSAVSLLVESDMAEENGQASGTWKIEKGELKFLFTTSSTSLYEPGQALSFKFDKVDSDYVTRFKVDNKDYKYSGPGLLLIEETKDTNDIDQDGNRFEVVVITNFFSQVGSAY